MRSIRILPALAAAALGFAGCGSQTQTTAPGPAGQQASSGGHSSSGINKINEAFKHMTPQQIQALKARLPQYMHAMEQCAKANGGAQAATLACMQSRGFGPPAP